MHKFSKYKIIYKIIIIIMEEIVFSKKLPVKFKPIKINLV